MSLQHDNKLLQFIPVKDNNQFSVKIKQIISEVNCPNKWNGWSFRFYWHKISAFEMPWYHKTTHNKAKTTDRKTFAENRKNAENKAKKRKHIILDLTSN